MRSMLSSPILDPQLQVTTDATSPHPTPPTKSLAVWICAAPNAIIITPFPGQVPITNYKLPITRPPNEQ